MFDDGQVDIYSITNTAFAGDLPKEGLTYGSSYWYEERTIGITRFYAALKTDVKLEMVIRIWRDKSIDTSLICKIDEVQYRIVQVQHLENEDGLEVTDISLEKQGETYDIIGT
jgi:hypothetical protein